MPREKYSRGGEKKNGRAFQMLEGFFVGRRKKDEKFPEAGGVFVCPEPAGPAFAHCGAFAAIWAAKAHFWKNFERKPAPLPLYLLAGRPRLPGPAFLQNRQKKPLTFPFEEGISLGYRTRTGKKPAAGRGPAGVLRVWGAKKQ